MMAPALSRTCKFIALGFGSGLAPRAPGTVGTLAAYPLYWLMAFALPTAAIPWVLLVFFVAGIWFCDVAGKMLQVPDHPSIVWDEIVAMLIILFAIPFSWLNFILAFALFRLFDITKPWPIRYFDQRLKNGFGVMFDDLLAAVFSYAALRLYFYFLG